MNLKPHLMALAAVACAGLATSASAVTTYTLGSTALSIGSAPYGTVKLTQSGADVNFDVSLRLVPDLDFVSTGNRTSHAIFAFNATGVVLGDIVGITSGSPTHVLVAYAGGHESPFGDFTFGIDCPTCAKGDPGKTLDDLTFTVKNAVVADFAHTSTGQTAAYFAADIIDLFHDKTGAIGSVMPGVTSVPEPETYSLMLAGLAGLAFIARRRSSRV